MDVLFWIALLISSFVLNNKEKECVVMQVECTDDLQCFPELHARDAKIDSRFDECESVNEYFDCHYWIYGYYLDDEHRFMFDDEGEEYPPPRPKEK